MQERETKELLAQGRYTPKAKTLHPHVCSIPKV